MTPMLSRRTLLAVWASVALLGTASARAVAGAIVRHEPAWPAHRLLAVLARPDSARAVGRRYLATVPAEADHRWLAQEIARSMDLALAELASRPPTVLAQLLRQRIRRDFREQRMRALDGWLLSMTELRLCALAAALDDQKAAPAGIS